jgi:hypothetical protein
MLHSTGDVVPHLDRVDQATVIGHAIGVGVVLHVSHNTLPGQLVYSRAALSSIEHLANSRAC